VSSIVNSPSPVHEPTAPDRPNARRWLALPVVLAGTFMTILDFFIVNVAIPSAQADLHANAAEVQFVVAGYGLAYAAGLITGGRLGDLYGRRRLFAVGLVAFTLASAACGLAPTAVALVVFRAIQGASAALMFPQVLSILNVAYTGEDRPRAFMGLGMTIGLASVSGQVVGGLLIGANVFGLSWRSCFLINVPVGIAALAALRPLVPESRSDSARRLDLAGVAIVTPGLLLLLVPLVVGRQTGWPVWSWACLAASAVVLALFARHQVWLSGRGGTPLVAPVLFTERAFVTGLATVLVVYAGMASFFLVFALYLQEGLHYAALTSGLIFMPCGVSFFLVSMAAPKLTRRIGRRTLTAGAIVLGAAEIAMALLADGTPGRPNVALLSGLMFVAGAGMGAMGAPLLSQVLLGVDPSHAGSASGVLSTTQQLAGALGVAFIGIIFYGVLGGSGRYGHSFAASLSYTIALAALTALVTAPNRLWKKPALPSGA